jgi:hypothetical protein
MADRLRSIRSPNTHGDSTNEPLIDVAGNIGPYTIAPGKGLP